MNTRTYKLISVLSNDMGDDRLKEYPDEILESSLQYPHLREYVEDEMDIFVVNTENDQNFYPASEFLFMIDASKITVTFEE